jgi:hypothetical protein
VKERNVPRYCTVCIHRHVAEIDQALVSGESLRNIAEQRHVSVAALFRHRQSHVPASLRAAQQASEAEEEASLLDQVRALRDRAILILNKAEYAGDLRTALTAIKELRGTLELLGRATGELRPAGLGTTIQLGPVQYVVRWRLPEEAEPYPADQGIDVAELMCADADPIEGEWSDTLDDR